MLFPYAARREKMGADSLIDYFEAIYHDMALVYPRCSWTRPQRWLEDEVCQKLVETQRAGKCEDTERETLRCLLSVRQAYRHVFGRPTAFDTCDGQKPVQRAGSKPATASHACPKPASSKDSTSANIFDYSGMQGLPKLNNNSLVQMLILPHG